MTADDIVSQEPISRDPDFFSDISDASLDDANLDFPCRYLDNQQTTQILSGAAAARQLSLLSINIQSLNSKFESFLELLDNFDHHFSAICLQEVWSIGKNFDIPGYHSPIFATRDQFLPKLNPNCGGGSAIYIRDDHNFSRLTFNNQFTSGIYESVWVKISLGGGVSIVLGSIYRPTTFRKTDLDTALSIHCDIINQIKNDPLLKKSNIYILGDYNIDLIKTDENVYASEYLESLINLGCLPCVTRPTRIRVKNKKSINLETDQSATLLDHIFSTSLSVKFSGIVLNDLSDHFPIFLVDDVRAKGNKTSVFSKRDTSDKCIDELYAFLKNVSWEPVLTNHNVIPATDAFFSILKTATEICFPVVEKKMKKIKINTKLPWYTPGLARCSKKKNRLFTKCKKNPTVLNCDKYKQYKCIFNSVCKFAKKQYLADRFDSVAKNSRATWREINSSIGRSTKSGQNFPTCFYDGAHTFDSPIKIANGFNNFFADIGEKLSVKIPKSTRKFESFLGNKCLNPFFFRPLTAEIVSETIRKMQPKCSYSTDLISNKILKKICPIIVQVLVHIFNLSLTSGTVHWQYKSCIHEATV